MDTTGTAALIEERLSRVEVGHVIHGTYGNEGSAICLVSELTENEIHTRAVTTQYTFVFDRKSGLAIKADGSIACTLDSIAQLPPDVHAAMLDIDRKFRLRDAPEGSKLLPHEIAGLLFVSKYYPENPLCDAEIV